MSRYMWGEYVPVHTRRAQAKKEMEKLQKKGQKVEPVEIEGRTIAKKFWGKKWCDHLESYADYENRLPRGRTYARNGSICHLEIQQGVVEAIVSGSDLYKISIKIITLAEDKWETIKKRCSDQIGSLLEILQGKLSDNVMEVVADHKEGLFPNTREMKFSCSCPDWADMCKHVAAVLYGVGNRLDSRPELLFKLRGVDPSELVKAQLNIETSSIDQLESGDLADIFGIDLEEAPQKTVSAAELPVKKVEKVVKVKSTKSTDIKPKKTKIALNLDKLTGADLSKYRVGMGFTVSEFAKALGVTTASIYRWEKSPAVLNLQASSKEALQRLLQKT